MYYFKTTKYTVFLIELCIVSIPVCRVWQNSMRSCAYRASFSRVHRVQYNLLSEYRCMPIERLSIRRIRVLGAFSWGSMPSDLHSMFMLYHYVHLKKRATNKITDKLPVLSFTYNLTILMRKHKCKQGMWK